MRSASSRSSRGRASWGVPAAFLLLSALASGGGTVPAHAEDAPPAGQPLQQIPRAAGLALDGRLDEAAWQQALLLSGDALEVPPAPPGIEKARLTPDVRLLEADGRLWIGVALAEDPGLGIGLRVMAGPESLVSAAEAVSIGFAPQEMRALRLSVRGPRGASRARDYPVVGAADWSRAGAWSLELSVPLAALDLGGAEGRLRLALAVTSRTPNLVSAVPAAALFSAPAAWLRLGPAAGTWSSAPAPDAEATALLASEDARDEQRLEAWRGFLAASQGAGGPAGGPATPEAQRRALLEPLEQVERLRPDLAAWVGWVRGDVLQRLGDGEGAEVAYQAALAAMPGCREAAFQLHVKLWSQALAEGLPSEPSDFARALARAADEMRAATTPYGREGAALARALLLYKQGSFVEAAELLGPLARRYPAEALITLHLERAQASIAALGAERQRRAAEEARGDLPRLTFTTSKGEIVFELFEDDAANAVKNVVWLADRGFYDGTAFHRNVPFFVLQGGDPFTREGAEARWVGGGGPGYAIATESSARLPLRGTLCLIGAGSDAEGSQFFLATGTAVHLKEDVSVVGRIVAGQEVADRLVQGDRLAKAVVTRRRAGSEYRPRTVAGAPASEPVATPPVR